MVDIENRMKNLHEVCESKSILPNEEQLQGMLSSAAESAAVATASAFLINSADQKGMIHLQSENERLNEKLELSQMKKVQTRTKRLKFLCSVCVIPEAGGRELEGS